MRKDSSPTPESRPAPTSEILAILDRSGSMGNCVKETIDGYNAFIRRQIEDRPLRTRLTTVLFDDRYELLHATIPLADALPITPREYFPRGSTALFDAIGRTLDEAAARILAMPTERRPGRVVVLVITDGLENASVQYSAEDVRRLIADRRSVGWEFFFLGAELDSFLDADRLGIGSNRRARYEKGDSHHSLGHVSKTVKDFLVDGSVDDHWDEGLGPKGGK